MNAAVREHLVAADGFNWNVAEAGQGETILLVHGTGASVHSWRDIISELAKSYHVLAIDLPGHGKSDPPSSKDYSLERMARGVHTVLAALKVTPVIAAGHSAGAAILAQMSAQMSFTGSLISFNGAFYPFAGHFGALFSPIAKLLALNPFLPRILAGVATPATVEKLLRDTGSNLSPSGVAAYYELFKDPKHVGTALRMMAAWDLRDMDATLAKIEATCVFVAGGNDKAVPPNVADRAAARCRNSKVLHIAGFGHLLHEEAPIRAANIIRGKGE